MDVGIMYIFRLMKKVWERHSVVWTRALVLLARGRVSLALHSLRGNDRGKNGSEQVTMWPVAALTAAASLLAAVVVYVEIRANKREEEAHAEKGTKKHRAFCKGMQEREYLPLIPSAELKRVKALLKRVSGLRGWQASPGDVDRAWQRATELVQCASGGAWLDTFSAQDLDAIRLQQLSTVLDETFLCGRLGQRLKQLRLPPLNFVVDDEFAGPCDWISYFAESNTIHLLRSKWSQEVSSSRPMICEGVLCTNRLQILLHTIAHEMVHAVVFNFWPDIDKASEAYLPDERHGPIFKLLNRRLFGHLNDSYAPVFKNLGQ